MAKGENHLQSVLDVFLNNFVFLMSWQACNGTYLKFKLKVKIIYMLQNLHIALYTQGRNQYVWIEIHEV